MLRDEQATERIDAMFAQDNKKLCLILAGAALLAILAAYIIGRSGG
jgi:hypothetical protein